MFGYPSCLILTANLPFSKKIGVIRTNSTYLPTRQARSALALSLAVNGAMGNGPINGCIASRNIAILEFYPIVLSVCLWRHKIQNHCILFFTDNESLVHVINKQSCQDKSLMFFVRKLVLACLKYNILFKAKHIPGIHNKLADCLSRFQVQTFKQLAPAHMNRFPTDIPQHLLPGSSPI